MTIQE
jgi:glycerophosphoryl diester phosphodiesterase